MEWPAPPSGVVGSPANQEEEEMDAVLGVDLGKNVCSVVGLDASGAVVMRRKVRRETLIALAEKLSSVRCRDGGLLRGSSSRLRVRRPRPRCPAGRRLNMSGPTSRRRRTTDPRRRGDRGGGDPTDDAVCRTEEPGPTRHADASSIARPVGRGADSSDQSVARHSA